jgi:hypothetical protein
MAIPAVDFGIFELLKPGQITASSLAQHWHDAVRQGRSQGCLFCERVWDAESESELPAAFVVHERSTSLWPVCASCAGGFSDDNALADQAMVLVKFKIWPPVDGQQVRVDRETRRGEHGEWCDGSL